MSNMLVYVPKTRAKTPKKPMSKFFHIIHFPFPRSSQYVITSITHGHMRPRIEKQKAPMRPMNGLIVGTIMARTTETKKFFLTIQNVYKKNVR